MNNFDYNPDMQQKAGLVGFIFMLVVCLLFVAAKVFGFVTWSWLWVFCPLWGPAILGLFLMAIGIKPPGQ